MEIRKELLIKVLVFLVLTIFPTNILAANITYYLGEGKDTESVIQIGGVQQCKGSCTLKSFDSFGIVFPLEKNQWKFAGWSTSKTGTDIVYKDKASISNLSEDISLYAVGSRTFRFSSGIAPKKNTSQVQRWNPCSTASKYATSITVPTPTSIKSWTFLGYRAEFDLSDNVSISSNQIGTYKPPVNMFTNLNYGAKYKRELTMKYNGNGGTGSVSDQKQTQYYVSGFGDGTKNSKAKISTIYWKLPENGFTRSNYDFNGWSNKKNDYSGRGPGLDYGLFTPLVNDTKTTETLYVIWEKHNENRIYKGESYGSYSEAIKIIKETMKAYYIKGVNIQYNSAKKTYGFDNPEEATSQDMMYKTCTGYTYSSYVAALGVSQSIDNFPRASFDIIQVARDYYNNNVNTNNLDGHYLLYYENKSKKIKYVYGQNDLSNVTIDKLANILQPGDILVFTGHGLIVYDIITRNTGEKDILILNSNGGPHLRTRDFSVTSRLYYNRKIHGLGTSNNYANNKDNYGNIVIDRTSFLDGTVWPMWLSDSSYFFNNDGKLDCAQAECAIIRPFYKKDSNNVVYNYSVDKTAYNRNKIRVAFPGLYIEKTVDKGDNNSVYFNDEVTYTINISNKSNIINDVHDKTVGKDARGNTYGAFTVEEATSPYLKKVYGISVIYDGKTYNGTNNSITINGEKISYKTVKKSANGKSKNVIIWKVPSGFLKAGKRIDLIYKGVVTDNDSYDRKSLLSTGIFYGGTRDEKSDWDDKNFITTGKVENTIIKKVVEANQLSYLRTCYSDVVKKTTKAGLEFIDEVYNNCLGISLNLKNFKFKDLIEKIDTSDLSFAQLQLKYMRETEDNVKIKANSPYKSMILNNYWNSLIVFSSQENFLHFPRWNSNNKNERAKTIYESSFRDGDILIYEIKWQDGIEKDLLYKDNKDGKKMHTKEDGMYAYIYIKDKFVGINYSGKTSERNEFTYKYYDNIVSKYSTIKYDEDFYSEYDNDMDEDFKVFLNYQTLYGKDAYVILRPEIVATNGLDTTPINGHTGDVNGDGIVSTADYNKVRRHGLFHDLKGEELKRADVNGDGSVSTADYNAIRRIIVNPG